MADLDWPTCDGARSVASWPSLAGAGQQGPEDGDGDDADAVDFEATQFPPTPPWADAALPVPHLLPARRAAQPTLLGMYRVRSARRSLPPSFVRAAGLVGYAAVGVCFTFVLVYVLVHYPLYPPRLRSLEWCRMWLFTTIADYYGA